MPKSTLKTFLTRIAVVLLFAMVGLHRRRHLL